MHIFSVYLGYVKQEVVLWMLSQLWFEWDQLNVLKVRQLSIWPYSIVEVQSSFSHQYRPSITYFLFHNKDKTRVPLYLDN